MERISTSRGTNGQPLVIALHGTGLSPVAFRATLAMAFLIQGTMSLGWLAGQRLFGHLDPERFGRVVLVMLACSGVLTLVSALT